MERDLKKYHEKLMEDKEKGLFSEVKVVNKKIDGKVREAIMLRSDEFTISEACKLPEILDALPFGDKAEEIGYTYIYSGEEQLEEESLADLVARV